MQKPQGTFWLPVSTYLAYVQASCVCKLELNLANFGYLEQEKLVYRGVIRGKHCDLLSCKNNSFC